MNQMITKENIKIENMIYEVRGKQVMLDSDLAMLFGYETKDLNRNVKNNISRFPEKYCFKLTEEEYKNLRCKNFTSRSKYGGRRHLPYVFTEYGITMLAGILKSDIAVKVSLQIVEAFITMRKYLNQNNYERRISNIETKLIDHENKFDKRIDNHIFFEGQIYDAYSLLIDILKEAKESIILIDNYIDKSILDVISLLDTRVTIITSDYNKHDIEKYKKQYDNIEIIHNKKFHDRFMIIDYKLLYHCGASFKDLDKKCFAINRIEEKSVIDELLGRILS